MSDPEIPLTETHRPIAAVPTVTLESLAADYRSLRLAFHVTLIFLMILTGSLFLFFLKEASIARREVAEYARVVGELRKSTVPISAIVDLRTKLQAYCRMHPDFLPIYTKYFGATNQPSSANVESANDKAPPTASGARLPPMPGR